MSEPVYEPLNFTRLAPDTMQAEARRFREQIGARRSVRQFSPEPIPPGVLEDCLLAAGSAPSGAHLQPWHFVVVTDPELKAQIREAAEREEQLNYGGRMPEPWLEVLRPLGTDAIKEHITEAPALIVVFAQRRPPAESGRTKNYYVSESVGIATGFLIAALHAAGLATLTHTPNPMQFLRELLERPENETPFVLLPVGFPAPDCQVPALERKPLEAISTWVGPRA
ncbi:MAG: nitroreductase family protein [Planctomycetes bacterium]|nr:nitroreductase family protein [Planctomycetota bacterium]